MNITIYSHYTGTTNGVVLDGQVRGGYFYPEGEGKEEATLKAKPTGKLKFDQDTGKQISQVLASWEGDNCGVQVLERGGGNGTRVMPVLWISGADRDGTVHQQEFPLQPGEYALGFVSVVVD